MIQWDKKRICSLFNPVFILFVKKFFSINHKKYFVVKYICVQFKNASL